MSRLFAMHNEEYGFCDEKLATDIVESGIEDEARKPRVGGKHGDKTWTYDDVKGPLVSVLDIRLGAHVDRPIFSDPRVKHTRDYRRPKYNEGRDAAWNRMMREEERRNRYNVRLYEYDSGEDIVENNYIPFAGRIDSHWEKAATYHNLWMRLVSVKVELENERKYIRRRMEEVKNR